MYILVASDNQEFATRVRQVLIRCGLFAADAPNLAANSGPQLVPLELAAERASRFVPALVVIVVQPDRERALAALRDVKHAVQTSILLVGPADDPKFILASLHEGADEYLDESRLEEELAESLIRLKTRQAQAEDDLSGAGRIIAVLGPSGGCGSSVLAVNLAAVLSQHHGSCGLVDLRLGAGDLAPLMDLKPLHSLADLCANLDRIDRELFEQFFVRHSSHVYLLAAPFAAGDLSGRFRQSRAAGLGNGSPQVPVLRRGFGPYVCRRTGRSSPAIRNRVAGAQVGLHGRAQCSAGAGAPK